MAETNSTPMYGLPCPVCGQPAERIAVYPTGRLVIHKHDNTEVRTPASQCVMPIVKD